MRPVQHPSSNDVLRAPPGVPVEQCRPLYITRIQFQPSGHPGIWSYWQPSAEELALLNAGKPVRLCVLGQAHPPVAIGVDGDGL